jgi:hypothetical protein
MKTLMDDVLNAPTGVSTSVTVSAANMIGEGLPFLINVATVIYLFLLIVHKGWKMYKEWKTGKDAPEE